MGVCNGPVGPDGKFSGLVGDAMSDVEGSSGSGTTGSNSDRKESTDSSSGDTSAKGCCEREDVLDPDMLEEVFVSDPIISYGALSWSEGPGA